MKKIIIFIIIFLLMNSLYANTKKIRQKNNITIIMNCDQKSDLKTRTMLDNQKLIKAYQKKNRRDRIRAFGMGFAVGGFTFTLGFSLLLIFMPRKN